MLQTNEYEVIQKEIKEIKADQKMLEKRVSTGIIGGAIAVFYNLLQK
ncbi:hypothetical protein [Bacillus haynesii]